MGRGPDTSASRWGAGGFILARAMHDPSHLRAQLTHLRHYLELLFGLPPADADADAAPAAAELDFARRRR